MQIEYKAKVKTLTEENLEFKNRLKEAEDKLNYF